MRVPSGSKVGKSVDLLNSLTKWLVYILKVSLEGPGPGRIRSGWKYGPGVNTSG